jgi:two-component system, LuxR family, sensor kinase FixL
VLLSLLRAGRPKILFATLSLVALATFADWATGHDISLAVVYILPMMLGAVVLRPWEMVLLAILCSYLRSWFDIPGTPLDLVLRFIFAALAYLASGLFVTALVRNREQTEFHLRQLTKEQKLRRDAEEQLRFLAESSPAAIFTTDDRGLVLTANGASNRMLMFGEGKTLAGRSIGDYLPFLGEALRLNSRSMGLRAATKCLGHRENGEIFLAHIWFSSYIAPEGRRLAAIAVDSSEELRDHEEQGLRHLLAGNEIAAAAIAHEVRNVCEAMKMLCEDLHKRHGDDPALRGLDSLVSGLESIASLELDPKAQKKVEPVPLREVLNNLRIIIEPAWREIDGVIEWKVAQELPSVWAERHGLLQVLLNITQNSHRAVQEASQQRLNITVLREAGKVRVQCHDSGSGVRDPQSLFRPFQEGAEGSGLGLYVSRFLVRSYGGELRYEPNTDGSCFVIELDAVQKE